MRLALLFAALLAAPVLAQSTAEPVRATTEDGRTILVYGDGTWRLDRSVPVVESIDLDLTSRPLPPPPPRPDGASTRTLRSASGAYTVEYDADLWSRPRASINEDAEFQLQLPFSAAYALAIYEAYPATNKQVRDIVVANARMGTGGPVTVFSERSIRVPGGEGIQVEFGGVADNGMEFVFITSAFGTDEGSLQITTFTAASAAERHRAAMLAFHDGIRLLKDGP